MIDFISKVYHISKEDDEPNTENNDEKKAVEESNNTGEPTEANTEETDNTKEDNEEVNSDVDFKTSEDKEPKEEESTNDDSVDTKIEFDTTVAPDENKEAVTDVVVDLTKNSEATETNEESDSEEDEAIGTPEQESLKALTFAIEKSNEEIALLDNLLANPKEITPLSAALAVESLKHISRLAGLNHKEVISLNMISKESLESTPEQIISIVKEDLQEMVNSYNKLIL